jgi:hypothetical protein
MTQHLKFEQKKKKKIKTTLNQKCRFLGNFSHFFDLKNTIRTHSKDFLMKNEKKKFGPNSPDFEK